MSRKHFEAIARTIRHELDMAEANYEPIGHAAMVNLTKELATTLAVLAPSFKRDVFLKACGIAEEPSAPLPHSKRASGSRGGPF